MKVLEDNPELILRSVNRRLAELLNAEPLQLAEGGARSIEDPLWVWGIVGGKEVGKTTLINALAGAEMVPPGVETGEGTYQPAALLAPDDASALRTRFAGLGSMAVSYHADASPAMRGVVLVDLPDFDSLFASHVEQVRRIATVLDGIIWVTTPKKIGDLRAITEIRRVLKARCNFVYAVNKIDWLLGQSDGPPQGALDRLADALGEQIAQCEPTGEQARTFLVSAKYRDTRAVLEAVARLRNLPDSRSLSGDNGALADAADRVVQQFEALKLALTTAPTAEATLANKRANLAYQVRRQADQLLEHYQPARLLERLEQAADPRAIQEHVARAFHPGYCAQVFERLNAGRALSADWSAALFKARLAHWPLLGIIAWPVTLIGTVLGGLRSLLPDPSGRSGADPFRAEGLTLEDRVDAVLARMRAELASVSQRVTIDLPGVAALAQQFRGEAATLAGEHRSAVIEPLLGRRPTLLGRMVRWVVPLAVLLWFPLVQPVLEALLSGLDGGVFLNRALAAALVEAWSAHNVLAGLVTSLIILAVLVAAVYSRAVRDTSAAVQGLPAHGADMLGESLIESLANTLRRPVEQVRAPLADATRSLVRLAKSAS